MLERQKVVFLILGLLLAAASLLVLAPFLGALIWAAVLAVVTWQPYVRLRALLRKQERLAAPLMTLLVAVGIFVPVVLVGATLGQQAVSAYQDLQGSGNGSLLGVLRSTYATVVDAAGRLPVGGRQIKAQLEAIDLPQVQEFLRASARQILAFLAAAGREVSESLLSLTLTIFTVFFFYAGGEALATQLVRALDRLGGPPLTDLLPTAVATVRAVVLGLVLTACAQGLLAGLGFWVAGFSLALVFALLTVVLAIVQIPTAVVWFPCVLWLVAVGKLVPAMALFAWGLLVVSTIDNLLKPLFISQGAGLPFLLVFFGVLGGLLAFGPLGIVAGPVILGLARTLWLRWVEA